MERQSRQRHRTSKNKIKQEIENKKDAAKIDKQTQTPRKMKEQKNQKRQNQRTEQSNRASCYITQDENNSNNIPQADTSPQDKIESCNIEHEAPSPTQTLDKNQMPINRINNVLPSDTDYEWWIYNHTYMAHQAQINSLTYLYEEPSPFLMLDPTEHNFIARFFQDESLNNLTSLSQASQKDLLELSKGNPDLPIISL